MISAGQGSNKNYIFEEYTMNPTVCTHKNNPNFWIFGLFFFLYFFIMATCFPFLPIRVWAKKTGPGELM